MNAPRYFELETLRRNDVAVLFDKMALQST
jgi:hypothetical protein